MRGARLPANPSEVRITQRPSNSYPGNASREMELEQQIALIRDQQEFERRNMEANVQARVDAERHMGLILRRRVGVMVLPNITRVHRWSALESA